MLLALAALLGAVTVSGAAQKATLMPMPAKMHWSEGQLPVDAGFGVSVEGDAEPRLSRAEQRFRAVLERRTGILVWKPARPETTLHVRVTGAGRPVQKLGEDESYRLIVDDNGGTLTAATALGAMHGLQTVLQLVSLDAKGFYLPAVSIEDSPRFPWRGLMLDTSRHFMPMAVIKRTLDGMEAVKLNVFHWHLSDNQGFRAESRVLPLLTARGSDGLFYTQEEMREVVAYARDRGIRVVPEFDLPGHTSAILAAYPELGSGSGPYHIERKWGIFDPALDPTREATYAFVDQLVAEMSAIFPDAYFHIGGDECNGKEWKANARIQEFMQKHGLRDERALQAYFSARVQGIVAAHGKIAVGWDEILQENTPQGVVIQSWHGPQAMAAAARSGHEAILSKGYYLDLNLAAETHDAVDPMDGDVGELSPEQQSHVLGGEAAMWTEYVSAETVDSRIWPRAAVIAEKLWSPKAAVDAGDLYARLGSVSTLLSDYGLEHEVAYPRMLQRIANGAAVEPLRVLGDVEEPTKGHARSKLGEYDAFTPLNRMVDAIPPESLQARRFAALCVRVRQGTATVAELGEVRELLMQWALDEERLRGSGSALSDDLAAASSALSDAARLGLAALDAIESRSATAEAWREAARKSLAEDAKPHAAMVLAVVEPILALVDATSVGARTTSSAGPAGATAQR